MDCFGNDVPAAGLLWAAGARPGRRRRRGHETGVRGFIATGVHGSVAQPLRTGAWCAKESAPRLNLQCVRDRQSRMRFQKAQAR